MEHTTNCVTLRGELVGLPEFSHENHGRRFFRFLVDVPRLSGAVDRLPVIAEEALVNQSGRAIRDIFAQDGEPLFRELETNVLATLGQQSGLVLATGGGCVTQGRNYPLLHQNGTIFCLQRNLDQLPVEGRPLSQATRIEEMFRIRKPLYERFADHMIDNNDSPESAANQILRIMDGNL